MSSERDEEPIVSLTTQKLMQALTLMQKEGAHLTASSLSRRAGISRTALYRYHPDILDELRNLQRESRNQDGDRIAELKLLENDNTSLKQQVLQLASLVDHYFAAWQESEALLRRREKEIATLRKLNVHMLRP